MQKKDFELIAKIISLFECDQSVKQSLATHFTVELKYRGDNPRFDAAKFKAACLK